MKTVIDLDPKLTRAAARVLGTSTKKDTVHAAMRVAIAAAKEKAARRARLLASAGSGAVGDEEIMAGAWR